MQNITENELEAKCAFILSMKNRIKEYAEENILFKNNGNIYRNIAIFNIVLTFFCWYYFVIEEAWSEVIGFNLFFNFCLVILYLEKLNQIRLNKRNINWVNRDLKNENIEIYTNLTFLSPYKNQILDVNRENILEHLKKLYNENNSKNWPTVKYEDIKNFVNLSIALERNKKDKSWKKISYNNGIYEGQVHNDLKEGWGIFNYNDGKIYSGQYKNNLANGFAFLKINNEHTITATYENGLENASNVTSIHKGQKSTGRLIDGKFVIDKNSND